MGTHASRIRGRGIPGFSASRSMSLVLAVAALAGTGCVPKAASPPRIGEAPAAVAIEPDVAAVWAELRSAQAGRLAALGTFSSAGDAVIRYTDEDGDRRTEQVDLRLWRVAPVQAAVRLSKVGSSFLLAGWNDARWWLLDESGDTPVLQIRRLGASTAGEGAAALLSPPTFLAMLGLVPWPTTPPASLRAFGTTPEGEPDGLVFELDQLVWRTGDEGEIVLPGTWRFEIRRSLDGPVRVAWLDDLGGVIATSQLERPESVETRGRAPGAWPSLPHRMRVTRRNGDEVVVRLDRPLAGGDVSPRLFDLDVVRRRVPEAIVDDEGGPPTGLGRISKEGDE